MIAPQDMPVASDGKTDHATAQAFDTTVILSKAPDATPHAAEPVALPLLEPEASAPIAVAEEVPTDVRCPCRLPRWLCRSLWFPLAPQQLPLFPLHPYPRLLLQFCLKTTKSCWISSLKKPVKSLKRGSLPFLPCRMSQAACPG